MGSTGTGLASANAIAPTASSGPSRATAGSTVDTVTMLMVPGVGPPVSTTSPAAAAPTTNTSPSAGPAARAMAASTAAIRGCATALVDPEGKRTERAAAAADKSQVATPARPINPKA